MLKRTMTMQILIFSAIFPRPPQLKNFRCGLPICLLAMVLACNSCAYRFTNLHNRPPEGIKTIAIEAIYDTGSEVVPHEKLWDELQRAFAANGHIKVASSGSSDALLRAHIKESNYSKAGTPPPDNAVNPANKSDPVLYQDQGRPIEPGLMPDLNRARLFYPNDRLGFSVDIEVWDLNKNLMILQRTYGGSSEILAMRNEPDGLMHIRHEESAEYAMSKMARSIAETVVSDLIVR
jgi:hypothetical protein